VTRTLAEILAIGFEDRDRQILARAPNHLGCDLIATGKIRDAIPIMGGRVIPVIVYRRDVPDGSWQDFLDLPIVWETAAKVIVVSRLADDRLWETASVVTNNRLEGLFTRGQVLNYLHNRMEFKGFRQKPGWHLQAESRSS
jgi:hypothetical protein